MPGKRYSAGAIFLQVVPVFANVQKAIEDEVGDIDRALGDRMEKAGAKAGDRAGKAMSDKIDEHGKKAADGYAGHFETRVKSMVKSAEREIGRLDLSTATDKMLADLDKAKASLKELGKTDFNLDFNAKKVLAEIQTVKAAVEGITEGQHELNIDANLRKVIKDAAKIEEIFDEATRDRTVEVKVDMDTKPIEREMTAFEKAFKKTAERAAQSLSGAMGKEAKRIREDLVALQNLRIGVDISAGRAQLELSQLKAELEKLGTDNVDIDIKVGALQAAAELGALDKQVDRLDGRDINIKAKVEDSGARSKLRELVAGGDNAANTFRSFNGILFAVVALGPALVPVLGAIAGGLMAIGPAAAVAAGGLTSVLIGFSGIGPALTALNNQQSQSAKAAEANSDRMRTAYRAVRDARQALSDAELTADRAAADSARRVADARRQAADQIESALKQQREAQQKYADSVKSVRDAENDLRQARADAAKDKQDLGFQIRENQLNISQGLVDEFTAKTHLDAVMADGSSTNLDKEQARIAYEQAKLRMDELRAEQKRLADEKIKQDKGISDADNKVRDAADKYNKALREQRDALRDLKEAEQGVSKARAQAARDIRDALREQARSAADNARAVARAHQGVQDALTNQADALSNVSTQQEAVNEAMANLGPAGQHFARFLSGLTAGFYTFRDQIQAVLLPSIEEAITGLLKSKNGAVVKGFLITMARAFGQFAKALSRSFQGPVWGQFFETLAAVGPKISKAYGTAFIKFAEAMASMLTTAAPYALMFANGLAKMMTAFADWAKSKKGQDGLRSFMDYAVKNGPKVTRFIGLLAAAAVALVKALAPWGDVVLNALNGFLKAVDAMNPKVLGGIVLGIVMIINASQSAYAIMQLLLGASALFSSPVGLIIVAIVALASGIALLYKTNKDFRAFADKAWSDLSKIIGKAWNESIKPALSDFMRAVRELWREVFVPFLTWVGPKLLKLAEHGIPLLAKAFAGAVRVISALIRSNVARWVAGVTLAALAMNKAWKAFQALKLLATIVKMNGAMLVTIARTYAVSAAQKAVRVATLLWAAAQWILNAALSPLGLIIIGIVLVIAALVAGVIYAYTHWGWFRKIVDGAIHGIVAAVKWLWAVIQPTFAAIWKIVKVLALAYFKVYFFLISNLVKAAFTVIKWYWHHVLSPVFSAIADAAKWLWKKAIKPAFDGVVSAFGALWRGIKSVWNRYLKPFFETVVPPIVNGLVGAFQTAVDGVKLVWEGLKKIIGTPLKWVLDTAINQGLIDGFNGIAKWVGQKGFNHVPIPKWLQKYANGGVYQYASGGVLPGYTPGRDPHKFYSPTGGRLELSGGEAIMRPEFTAAVGKGFVSSMNAIARSRGVEGVRAAMGGRAFAKGGVYDPDDKVYINGMAISRVAAAQVALAKQKSGINIYMMQGGFGGNHVAASGSSHNYPGVGDFGPGSISLEKIMRQVGFAAWARNVPGRSQVGSGAHVHAVSLLDPGDRRSPQVTGSWAHNGNGLSGYNNDPAPHYAWLPGLAKKISSMSNSDIASIVKGGESHPSIPGKILNFIKNPLAGVKNWVTGTWDKASRAVKDSPIFDVVKKAPLLMAKKFTDKAWGMIPGWAKAAAGWAGDAAHWAVGGVKHAADAVGDGAHAVGHAVSDGAGAVGDFLGFKDGGILPYNGTMMYDNGGYLPPGLTSVVNLTGKPEPVFTSEQFSDMGVGGQGGSIHYEPHFEGSDLTAEDVAGDMNFAFRKLRRGGKYEGIGAP